jgi:dipeptidyl aminopeptidase/acylaminoacyl peptidase
LSPDGRRILFTRRASGSVFQIWSLELDTGATNELTNPSDGWDTDPRWRSDGAAFSYLHVRRAKGGVQTSLLEIEGNNRSQEILSTADGVLSFSYSPDSSEIVAFTKMGLQRINLVNRARKTLLDRDRTANFRMHAGTLDWSKCSGGIAFAMHNIEQKRDEIWTIAPDGTAPRCVWSRPGARIVRLSFVHS